jgi:hypothetical protein
MFSFPRLCRGFFLYNNQIKIGGFFMFKKEIKKYIILAVILFILSIFTIPVVYADTDGNELRITAQPDKLVLQFGKDWAGVESKLKLDSGVFPVPIKADSSGVLIMELGGSKTYTLTRLTPKPVPATNPPEPKPEPTTNMHQPVSDITETETETTFPENETNTTESVSGIEPPENSVPLLPLIIFLSGLILAVIVLLVIRAIKRRREYDDEYEYDDEE